MSVFLCLAAIAIDGDTLRCQNLERPGLVRLARIDAPERGQAGAREATQALRLMIAGRTVTCELVDADPRRKGFQKTDRYGRPVARCSAGGVDLGAALIKAGHAVAWPPKP
jgi:endonuclease YncB( thermonuclease family)